jgi:hypothetical protein
MWPLHHSRNALESNRRLEDCDVLQKAIPAIRVSTDYTDYTDYTDFDLDRDVEWFSYYYYSDTDIDPSVSSLRTQLVF